MSVGRKLRAESAAPFLKVSHRAGGDGGHVLCRDGDRDVKGLMRHLPHRTLNKVDQRKSDKRAATAPKGLAVMLSGLRGCADVVQGHAETKR